MILFPQKIFLMPIALWITLSSGMELSGRKVMDNCPESIADLSENPPIECWPMVNRFCYCVNLRTLTAIDTITEVVGNWLVAQKTCSSINMTLVAVDTPEKNKLLEYFVTQFLGKSHSQVYWIGGAYNEVQKKFFWFDYQKPTFIEVQDFNYTNWAVDIRRDQLTGKECVLFNCMQDTCQWELGHCEEKELNFICEAPLTPSYKFPSTTRRPKVKKSSSINYRSSERTFYYLGAIVLFLLGTLF